MRFGNSNTYHQLLLSVDALNTIHGGVSEPYFKMEKEADKYAIHVRIPGVDAEKVKIEVDNNTLLILYYHSFDHGMQFGVTKVPYIVRRVDIPFGVDIKKIGASFDGQDFYISLPYSDLAGGYRKEIDINNK